jgi:hypothetical protein
MSRHEEKVVYLPILRQAFCFVNERLLAWCER